MLFKLTIINENQANCQKRKRAYQVDHQGHQLRDGARDGLVKAIELKFSFAFIIVFTDLAEVEASGDVDQVLTKDPFLTAQFENTASRRIQFFVLNDTNDLCTEDVLWILCCHLVC